MKNYKYGELTLDLRSIGFIEYTEQNNEIDITDLISSDVKEQLFNPDLSNRKNIIVLLSGGFSYTSESTSIVDEYSNKKIIVTDVKSTSFSLEKGMIFDENDRIVYYDWIVRLYNNGNIALIMDVRYV